jgi:hypothetical protein
MGSVPQAPTATRYSLISAAEMQPSESESKACRRRRGRCVQHSGTTPVRAALGDPRLYKKALLAPYCMEEIVGSFLGYNPYFPNYSVLGNSEGMVTAR